MLRMNAIAVAQLCMMLGSLMLFIALQGQFSFLKRYFEKSRKLILAAEIVLGIVGAYGTYGLVTDFFGKGENIDLVDLNERVSTLEGENKIILPDVGNPNDPNRSKDLLERYGVKPDQNKNYEF